MGALPQISGGKSRGRIIVADDSTFMRRVLIKALTVEGFEVVGEAADGDEALTLYRRQQPDAMTLDLTMPGTDGIGVLRGLGACGKLCPVVIVSGFSPAFGIRAVDVLAEGAFDLVVKPAFGDRLDRFSDELARKLEAAVAAAGTMTDSSPVQAANEQQIGMSTERRSRRVRRGGVVVVIALSTGGPKALASLVPQLPSPLGAGGYVIQHMPAGFTASLAARLDAAAQLNVIEAQGDEMLRPDTLILAPGGSHLRFTDGGFTRLSAEAPIGGLRPRADLTISDLVRIYGDRILLVVMTGMGKDGLDGARMVSKAGGRIIAEDKRSCAVYGMPRVVIEAGLADVVAPLDGLADAITTELS